MVIAFAVAFFVSDGVLYLPLWPGAVVEYHWLATHFKHTPQRGIAFRGHPSICLANVGQVLIGVDWMDAVILSASGQQKSNYDSDLNHDAPLSKFHVLTLRMQDG